MRITVFFCLLIGFCNQGMTDWNADFDKQRRCFIRNLPEFQTEEYSKNYRELVQARKALLVDSFAKKEIAESSQLDKIMLIDSPEGFVVKKRKNDNINEFFVWELSHLLGVSEFIVPSFAVEMGKKKIVLQEKEFFIVGKGVDEKPHLVFLKKNSLKDYWKAHLGAYLLGLGDLSGVNIGVSLYGKIRFFDNESSLKYQNDVRLNGIYFKPGFSSKSFDWPQYRNPLDKSTARALRAFVQSLSNLEEHLQTYLACRSLQIDEEGFAYRLAKVRSFVLEEGVSFRDFYGSLFPRIDPGLEELNEIVSEITNRSVDHGSALLFVSRLGKNYELSRSQKRAMKDWMDTYIYSP